MIGDCCQIGIPYKFNWNTGEWELNGKPEPCGFITTELDFEECQTMILAFVSGVDEDIIINGDYLNETQERIVDEAIQIIEEHSMIYLEYMPDPCVGLVKNKIKLMKNMGIKYVWYDYIHTTPSLLQEFRDLRVREDVALMMFSAILKQLANDLGMHISTATQLNAEGNSVEAGFKGVNTIRGAKSINTMVD